MGIVDRLQEYICRADHEQPMVRLSRNYSLLGVVKGWRIGITGTALKACGSYWRVGFESPRRFTFYLSGLDYTSSNSLLAYKCRGLLKRASLWANFKQGDAVPLSNVAGNVVVNEALMRLCYERRKIGRMPVKCHSAK